MFVSAVKNETRNLEKEINNLEASINAIEFNLQQAILDNEVITSPENIQKLAKENLNLNLKSYKRIQIQKLEDEILRLSKININNKKKNKTLSLEIKEQVAKKIEGKKTELRKLKEFYSNPKSMPKEIKTQVAKQIKEKKVELKNIYESPKEIITLQRVGKWSVVQVVKAFFGMPVIPGR